MQEHPFAPYIRILGRGKKGARSLTRTEAREAMTMILAGEVTDVQLGAFLMLVRVKEEGPEELAGFVEAARRSLALGRDLPRADIDWPCYAGKRRHLPWFILSARLIAQRGHRVFMHGVRGHKDDRVYAEDAIRRLGLPVCDGLDAAGRELEAGGLAFTPLEALSPGLRAILDLRAQLGLRSPINTLLRMLNPLSAPCMFQGIFHPGYLTIHQTAGRLLGQPHMLVFRGEGGEAERNPDAACRVHELHLGEIRETEWPALFTRRHARPERLDPARLAAVWRGEASDEYGQAAVIATAALVLRLLDPALGIDAALAEATALWEARATASQGPAGGRPVQ